MDCLNLLHCLGWQLNLAMPHLAVFQFVDVLLFEGEALKVRKLWRITEALDCQIAWELAQRVDVRGKLRGNSLDSPPRIPSRRRTLRQECATQ